MKDKKIRVVVKNAGQPAEEKEIENSLEALQEIVGGYIEITSTLKLRGIDVVCNEEGKFMDLLPNIHWNEGDVIFGNVVFLAHNEEGDAISLNTKQIAQAKDYAGAHDASEYEGDPEELARDLIVVYTSPNAENIGKVIFGDDFIMSDALPPENEKGDMEM